MSEVVVTVDNEGENKVNEGEQNANETLEENQLEAAQNEAEQEQEQDQPEINHADVLRQAKLAHLVEAYLPEGTDVESELAHVGGLEVGEDGTVTGTPVYRKPTVSNKSSKVSTAKTSPRQHQTAPTSWEQKRDKIRQQKIAAGLVRNY